MSCTYIMTDNFIDTDVVSNATVSSEQTAFPVLNVYNKQRRSKVWRSNGYFEITSANSSLVFRETTATDLTATLTEGSYASSALLFAEIKTQMEAVGASTYTIERATGTEKVKFTSNGVGGGGIFEIDWTTSTGLASLLGFSSASEDTGALTYTADSLKIHSEEWVKWDFGISTNPKAFIMIGARNDPIAISPSATIKLQANETDIWTAPTFEQEITYGDSVMALFDDTGLFDEALRYARLSIIDSSNPLGYVEIGSIFLGDFFSSSRGGVNFPFSAGYVDRSPTVYSEGGQSFSDIRQKTESFSLNWEGLTVADKEILDAHFTAVGTAVPFFVSVDSNAAFSSDSNYYIRYVKFEREPRYSLESPGNFSMAMDLLEQL